MNSCNHGVSFSSVCMLCIREGEGKPSSEKDDKPAKTFEECMTEPEPWAGGDA